MATLLMPVIVMVVAFLYSSVGFGGATGYLAGMSLFGISPQIMTSTALMLNIIVASISFSSFYRAGHLNFRLLWPFLATSIPAAFLGGLVKLPNQIYFILLYAVLTYTAVRLIFFPKSFESKFLKTPSIIVSLLVGAGIGFLSAIVGIGGGIFLSPIIILAGWGTSKEAAITAAAFIVLNSISGLVGRMIGGNFALGEFSLIMIPFGVAGALAGSYLGAKVFNGLLLRRILGIVMSVASINYWTKIFFK